MKIRFGITARLLLVAVLIVVVQLVANRVRATLEPAEIALPDWKLSELPLTVGDWNGEKTELDERIFRKIGADQAEDWLFHLPDGRTASVHIALFEDLDEGVWHYPANCYQSNGWYRLDGGEEQVSVEGYPPRTVSVSTWERQGERAKVLYWYQLGEHTIFGRYDLGRARLALAGRETWPPLVKVLLQTDAEESVEARLALLELGGYIHSWLYDRGIGGGDGLPVAADQLKSHEPETAVHDDESETDAEPDSGQPELDAPLPGAPLIDELPAGNPSKSIRPKTRPDIVLPTED